MAIDVSQAQKRAEQVSTLQRNLATERFEGEFEVTYEGLKTTVGK